MLCFNVYDQRLYAIKFCRKSQFVQSAPRYGGGARLRRGGGGVGGLLGSHFGSFSGPALSVASGRGCSASGAMPPAGVSVSGPLPPIPPSALTGNPSPARNMLSPEGMGEGQALANDKSQSPSAHQQHQQHQQEQQRHVAGQQARLVPLMPHQFSHANGRPGAMLTAASCCWDNSSGQQLLSPQQALRPPQHPPQHPPPAAFPAAYGALRQAGCTGNSFSAPQLALMQPPLAQAQAAGDAVAMVLDQIAMSSEIRDSSSSGSDGGGCGAEGVSECACGGGEGGVAEVVSDSVCALGCFTSQRGGRRAAMLSSGHSTGCGGAGNGRVLAGGCNVWGSTGSFGASVFQEALARFQTEDIVKEIAILKKLSHPNIVNLIEVIDDPSTDSLLLVMEYVEGGTLQPREAGQGRWQPVPESEVWKYVRQVLQVGSRQAVRERVGEFATM